MIQGEKYEIYTATKSQDNFLRFYLPGGARQTGEVITQMADITKGDLTVGAHSQGTMMIQNGMVQNIDELSNIVQNNKESKFLVQYSGSPVSSKAVEDLVVNELYGGKEVINNMFNNEEGINNVFRSQVNPGDFIGLLGGNFGGINNNAPITTGDFLDQAGYTFTRGIPTIMNGSLQNNLDKPKNTSPHSGYPCVIGCGDNGATPNDIKFYFDVATQNDKPLSEYYKKIDVDPSKAKFNTGSN